MEEYIPIILCLPIVWFLVTLICQILSLFYTWLKIKLDEIKEGVYK